MNQALSWLLALVIGAALIYLGGYSKLYMAEFTDDMVSKDLFAQISVVYSHFIGDAGNYMEPWGRRVVGVLEVIVGIMVILPMTRGTGAVLAILITLGAIATHLAGEFAVPADAFADAGVEPFGIAASMPGAPDYALFATAILLFIGSIIMMRVDSPR